MGSKKVQVYIVQRAVEAKVGSRLVRGSLKGVESLLRGEVSLRIATPDEAHTLHMLKIEDATGEPV